VKLARPGVDLMSLERRIKAKRKRLRQSRTPRRKRLGRKRLGRPTG